MEIGKPIGNSMSRSINKSIWNSVMDLTRISTTNSVLESTDNSFKQLVLVFFNSFWLLIQPL